MATIGERLARFDPRELAIRFPRATVAIGLAITAVMLYGNVITRKGGVLDDPILDETNPIYQSDLYVKARLQDGFQAREYIPFILKFPDGITSRADLERIRDFTERLKATFGPPVLSLSEMPEYVDTGDELRNEPYIPKAIPAAFDAAAWKQRVAAAPSVYGIFVGRTFDYAVVVRYLPPGYDEILEFRRTVEFIEQRTIPWWEWLYKTDITTPDDLGIGGWVIGRGLLDQATNVDTFTLSTAGIALAFPIFIWCLGSVREALIGVLGVVLTGLVWTRGTIGLLDWLGFDVRERVYTLLAYTNCIVQGVSFVLHKFEAFNHALDEHPDASRDLVVRWRYASSNDRLIAATAVIAVFGFATLYWFQVLSIRELGVLSAMAVAYQTALIILWVPAIHLVTARVGSQRPSRPSRLAASFQRRLDDVVARCAALSAQSDPRRAAWVAGGSLLAITALAAVMVWPGGMLSVKMDALKFIGRTVVGRTGTFLNDRDRGGFSALDLLIEPADGNTDIYDPDFLVTASTYLSRLQERQPIREVGSILDQVRQVSAQSLHKPLPTTRQEARAVFNIIEGDLNTGAARQLFYRRGLRVTTTCECEDGINDRAVIDWSIELAATSFPQLRVSPFGKSALSPQVLRYIIIGKPWNLFSSQLIVIVFCWFGVWLKNRSALRTPRRTYLAPAAGGLVMSAPFLFATAMMVLLMMAFRIPLDPATAAITALAINASVDFSIYFTDSYQDGLAAYGTHARAVEHAMRHKGRVVLEDMLLNSICFLPLTTSRFEQIRDVGWIMMIMLPSCAFGTVVIMPMLFYASLRTAPGDARAPTDAPVANDLLPQTIRADED